MYFFLSVKFSKKFHVEWYLYHSTIEPSYMNLIFEKGERWSLAQTYIYRSTSNYSHLNTLGRWYETGRRTPLWSPPGPGPWRPCRVSCTCTEADWDHCLCIRWELREVSQCRQSIDTWKLTLWCKVYPLVSTRQGTKCEVSADKR